MSEKIRLTEQWSLRKLQLGDCCEWALQYCEMDWFRISEFLPSENDTSMDDDIRKFAAAVVALSPPEPTGLSAAEVARIFLEREYQGRQVDDFTVTRLEQLILRARSDGATMVAEQQTEAKP